MEGEVQQPSRAPWSWAARVAHDARQNFSGGSKPYEFAVSCVEMVWGQHELLIESMVPCSSEEFAKMCDYHALSGSLGYEEHFDLLDDRHVQTYIGKVGDETFYAVSQSRIEYFFKRKENGDNV